MSERETLLALAARCEAATGADRELDAEIARAAGWVYENFEHWWSPQIVAAARKSKRGKWFHGRERLLPSFTASLDAAMMLVPAGWVTADANNLNIPRNNGGWAWALDNGVDCGHPQFRDAVAKATTPALALCAAALRAKAEGSV